MWSSSIFAIPGSSEQAARDEVVVPCDDLTPMLAFFTDELGFRLDMIMPADDPRLAVISGHGLRLRLQQGAGSANVALRLPPFDDRLEVTRPLAGDESVTGIGRAGMHYRDLIPGRQGGRVIASEITIPNGGPVPDYVHHHRIRFQIIYCTAGWVRAVYEDQGDAFVLASGDCVAQPPGIRHRVLESSAGAQVIEVSSPALHETHVDHELVLPTSTLDSRREFGGQRFVRHEVRTATWAPWRDPAFQVRDTGIGTATDGAGGVRVIRAAPGVSESATFTHDGELLFWYVLQGDGALDVADRRPVVLSPRTAVTIPAHVGYRLADTSAELELLEVTIPGGGPITTRRQRPFKSSNPLDAQRI